MKAECSLELEFDSEKMVKAVLKSVSVDDFDFVKSEIIGKKLFSKIQSSSISSLIHTLDDYLACVSVAGKVLDKN